MTPEAQRIAIAEACGWRLIENGPNSCYWNNGRNLPNYLSDLNAMHEAEKVMTDWDGYDRWIEIIVRREIGDYCHRAHFKCATAAQRAEAFLRTLNLWTE